jgi:hypothetical protein
MMKIELFTIQDCESEEVKSALDTLNETKRKAVERNDEDKANECWRNIEAIDLNILFIQAFQKIKDQKYRDAWCDLERCEISCGSLEENSSETFLSKTRVSFIKDKTLKWQSLYPYRVFASPGFNVGYYTCSICGHKIRPRSKCEHKKGKIYNGELCLHMGHDLEFKEISLVTNPVQKYSVVHYDETLDFSLLIYLSKFLDNAFEDWDLNWTTMKYPIEKFSSVEPSDVCPCKSGDDFESCCMKKDEVEIPHVDFIFFKPIDVSP